MARDSRSVLHDDRPRLLPRPVAVCRGRSRLALLAHRAARRRPGPSTTSCVGACRAASRASSASRTCCSSSCLPATWRGRRCGSARWRAQRGARAWPSRGGAALALSPQFVAYRALNGAWGPSRLVTRKMSFASPHFLEVLFDPGPRALPVEPAAAGWRAGALGAARASSAASPWSWLLGAGALLQVWINGSVESWTQAGAFGSRRFVAATPVFAWGLATVLALRASGRGRAAAAGRARPLRLVERVADGAVRPELMDRQRLEWPRVAINQVTEVPRHSARAAWLFLTDRERLAQGGPVISRGAARARGLPGVPGGGRLRGLRARRAAMRDLRRLRASARAAPAAGRTRCGSWPTGDALRCPCCGVAYPVVARRRLSSTSCRGPRWASVTQYADHEFHERLHVTDAPPVLSARVKADMMRRHAATRRPGEARARPRLRRGQVRALTRRQAARAPPASTSRRSSCPGPRARWISSLGDLRRLPFRKGAFPRAYSPRRARAPRRGGRRARCCSRRGARSAPRGRLFVYTHAMESSRLASLPALR